MEFFFGAIVLVIGANIAFRLYKTSKRRKSLHRDDAGFYIWIDFDGNECRSRNNPDAANGEWHQNHHKADHHHHHGDFGGGGDD